ncbi:MAG TPA: undecaprenyl-phosphate glucose phosphotransferase, partial [Caldimonas sp.]
MFDDPHKRTFFSAPQSVQSLIAAFLEPGITVLTFVVATLLWDPPIARPELMLCLLVFALTFPGRDRFREPLLGAAVDIASSWIVLLAILALCGFATGGFLTRNLDDEFFKRQVLLAWAIATPVLQWLATWLGRTVIRRREARRASRRTAVVVGA